MPEQDFMPIQNYDYVEFYVGDAKQAAYYYTHAWGFTPIAYAGLETGMRDRASYVLEQGNIRFVITSHVGADGPDCRPRQAARRWRQGYRPACR